MAAAPEAEGVFAVAQPVDEGPELPHVPHPPRHHHLLLDDVRLRKVRPPLQEEGAPTGESPTVGAPQQTAALTANHLRPCSQQ